MATTGGMHCTCSDTMAASCVLPPADAAGNWTQLLLLAALRLRLARRDRQLLAMSGRDGGKALILAEHEAATAQAPHRRPMHRMPLNTRHTP